MAHHSNKGHKNKPHAEPHPKDYVAKGYCLPGIDELRQAHKDLVVKGLGGINGTKPRRDIDELLFNHEDTFNLFLLAFKELQSQPTTIWTSYAQLAGIHGLPNRAWDNVHGKQDVSEENIEGYCPHGTPYFPTWHRPYLALLEQSLFLEMVKIAEKFSGRTAKEKYRKAYLEFRLPFWDVHRPRSTDTAITGIRAFPWNWFAPWAFTMEKIMVKMWPRDEPSYITNPLHHFSFERKTNPENETLPFMSDAEWKVSGLGIESLERYKSLKLRTVRQEGFVDKRQALNGDVNKIREDMVRLILHMLDEDPKNPYNDYENFATSKVRKGKAVEDTTTPFGSIEDIHNSYHFYVGQLGHMGNVQVAAFDPIFWFHHCNIDRWFAIWQAANPNELTREDGWFQRPDADSKKPLYPFRKVAEKNGQKTIFWDSPQVWSTETFGYTYADLFTTKNGHGSVEDDADEVRSSLVDRYGWSRRLDIDGPTDDIPNALIPMDLANKYFFNYPLDTVEAKLFKQLRDPVIAPTLFPGSYVKQTKVTESAPRLFKRKHSYEWWIDTTVNKFAVNGTFTINYFVGLPEETLKHVIKAETFAGSMTIFSSRVEVCDNCSDQENQKVLVSGTAPITSIFFDYYMNGELENLKPENVAKLLAEKLHGNVFLASGDPYPERQNAEFKPAELDGLQVSVSCKVAPMPGCDDPIKYYRIKNLKVQGLKQQGEKEGNVDVEIVEETFEEKDGKSVQLDNHVATLHCTDEKEWVRKDK